MVLTSYGVSPGATWFGRGRYSARCVSALQRMRISGRPPPSKGLSTGLIGPFASECPDASIASAGRGVTDPAERDPRR